MKTTIYIPLDKEALFQEAKEKLGDGVSATFVKCLERELNALKQKIGRTVVKIYSEEKGAFEKKAFEGRWLIGDENRGVEFPYPDQSEEGSGSETFSVALTGKGKLAVFYWLMDEHMKWMNLYDNFEEVRAAKVGVYVQYPASFLHSLADTLGVENIEVLDI